MDLLKSIVLNCIGESTKNLQVTKGKGESITHQNRVVPQIQTRVLQKVIVILTQIHLHLSQVPPVMTGGERERGLGKINIDVEKEENNTETRDEGNKTKDQDANQEGIDFDFVFGYGL